MLGFARSDSEKPFSLTNDSDKLHRSPFVTLLRYNRPYLYPHRCKYTLQAHHQI